MLISDPIVVVATSWWLSFLLFRWRRRSPANRNLSGRSVEATNEVKLLTSFIGIIALPVPSSSFPSSSSVTTVTEIITSPGCTIFLCSLFADSETIITFSSSSSSSSSSLLFFFLRLRFDTPAIAVTRCNPNGLLLKTTSICTSSISFSISSSFPFSLIRRRNAFLFFSLVLFKIIRSNRTVNGRSVNDVIIFTTSAIDVMYWLLTNWMFPIWTMTSPRWINFLCSLFLIFLTTNVVTSFPRKKEGSFLRTSPSSNPKCSVWNIASYVK